MKASPRSVDFHLPAARCVRSERAGAPAQPNMSVRVPSVTGCEAVIHGASLANIQIVRCGGWLGEVQGGTAQPSKQTLPNSAEPIVTSVSFTGSKGYDCGNH